ncbi:MAG: tetratricopeptide repeat protein [Nitrospirota bacterium]
MFIKRLTYTFFLLPVLIIMASCSANRTAVLNEPAPPLSEIAEKLNTKDKETRWEAISFLEDYSKNNDDHGINALLIRALRDNDPEIRLSAVRALANNKKIEPLIQLLKDDVDWLVRAEVLKSIYEVKKKDSLPYIKIALKDKESSVREEAVYFISMIKDREAVPLLIAALNDSHRDVKRKAINALSAYEIEKPIINLFNDEDPLVREEVLKVLVQMKSPSASDLLLMGLWDEKVNVRRKAVYLLGQKRYKHSLEPLTGALNDSDAIVRIYAAEALGNLGNQKALPALIEAAAGTKDNSLIAILKSSINKLKPTDDIQEEAVAYYKKGIAYQNRMDIEKAIEAYNEAIRIYPDYSDAHYSLGKIYSQQKLFKDAASEFRKALLNPHYSRPELCYVELGKISFENSLYDEAASEFKKALLIKKDYAEAHNNLGLIYKKKRLYDMAISEFREAINIDRNYAAAYKNTGDTFFDLKRYKDALSGYKSALNFNPLDPAVHNSMGDIYNILGLYDDAIREYREALNIMDYNSREILHSNLSRVYNKKRMYEAAIAEAIKAIRLRPDYAEAHNNLGYAYMEKEMYDKAIEELKKAMKLKPDDAEAHNNLGWAYEKSGEFKLAMDAYKKAIQTSPNWELPKNNLRRLRGNNPPTNSLQ